MKPTDNHTFAINPKKIFFQFSAAALALTGLIFWSSLRSSQTGKLVQPKQGQVEEYSYQASISNAELPNLAEPSFEPDPMEIANDQARFEKYQQQAQDSASPTSLFHVGAAHMFGRGTATNYTEAQKYLYFALKEGHADAAYLLGIHYLSGVGRQPDEVHAYRLFLMGIERGSRLGYGEAGRMREIGLGVAMDKTRAFELYIVGAKLGDPYCMKRLALISIENGQSFAPEFAKDYEPFRPESKVERLSLEARGFLPESFLY